MSVYEVTPFIAIATRLYNEFTVNLQAQITDEVMSRAQLMGFSSPDEMERWVEDQAEFTYNEMLMWLSDELHRDIYGESREQ